MAKKGLLVYHWTGGIGKPNSIDLNSYQELITVEGESVLGTNSSPSSIAGLNTLAYNISFCAGLGYQSPKNPGKYLIYGSQLEKGWLQGAKFLVRNGLPVSKVYTHSVIGELVKNKKLTSTLGIADNRWLINNIGKVDIDFLRDYPDMNRHQILDLFRQKIEWYRQKIITGQIKC